MTIRFWQKPLPDTRTPNDSCKWQAWCEVGGVRYQAESRRGATHKLARVLQDAGVPDAAVEIYDELDVLPKIRYKSFYEELAPYTFAESAKASLRMGKFVDPSQRIGAVEDAEAC